MIIARPMNVQIQQRAQLIIPENQKIPSLGFVQNRKCFRFLRWLFISKQMWLRVIQRFHSLAHTIYRSQSIEQRILAFQTIEGQTVQPMEVQNPSFLRQGKAKDVLDFVRQNSVPNNVRILHALAHIEYNAFMAYADTLFRFTAETAQFREEFQHDMKRVAKQEGGHFLLLKKRMNQLGFDYGQLPVIGRLTLAIKETQGNLAERIAVISVVHEGRGVQAVEKLLGQLSKAGDEDSVNLVKIIQRDEHTHFQLGWKWLTHACSLKSTPLSAQIQRINTKFNAKICLP